jgi:hypothetical protein
MRRVTNLRRRIARWRNRRWATRARARGIPRERPWRRKGTSRVILCLALSGDVVFVVLVGLTAVDWGGPLLTAATTLLGPPAVIAVSYSIFLFWRRRSVIDWYLDRAKRHPEQLVPTASFMRRVVGRDELCKMLMENIRTGETARPNIIVGGVGAGKTATLVQLARLLAAKGVIPVAIRLRGLNDGSELDFASLAYEKFKQEVDGKLWSVSNADRIWRQLLRDGRLVVLADGLDETLHSGGSQEDRETAIRRAVQTASSNRLPLVIASRPHPQLRALEATLTELEPLGEGPALEYLVESAEDVERKKLTTLVQRAEVSSSPLHLRIICEIQQQQRKVPDREGDWLDQLIADETGDPSGLHDDRTTIRLRLLEKWVDLLQAGYLYEDYALKKEVRVQTIEVLSALACLGLRNDSLEVPFSELLESKSTVGPRLRKALRTRLQGQEKGSGRLLLDSSRRQDKVTFASWCALATTMGGELGIVEARENSVRFRHGIVQAFLGSRFLDVALADSRYVNEAVHKSGREWLIALVLHSRTRGPARANVGAADTPNSIDLTDSSVDVRSEQASMSVPRQSRSSPAGQAPVAAGTSAARRTVSAAASSPEPAKSQQWRQVPTTQPAGEWMQKLKKDAAKQPDIAKRLRQYSAILEIDSVLHPRGLDEKVVREVAESWERFQEGHITDHEVIDARAGLAHRIGSAIRLATRPLGVSDAGQNAGTLGVGVEKPGVQQAYKYLFAIAQVEQDYAVRAVIARELGEGGPDTFAALDEQGAFNFLEHPSEETRRVGKAGTKRKQKDENDNEDESQDRRATIALWLAPLLYRTCGETGEPPPDWSGAGPATQQVDESLRKLKSLIHGYLSRRVPERPNWRPPIRYQVAIAQGLKQAANLRPVHADPYDRRRTVLFELGEVCLQNSSFWFSQLTLVQALTLLSLPADPEAQLPDRGHGSDPGALVDRWLGLASGDHGRVHPLVWEAARFAKAALINRRPEQFCWMDEIDAVGHVGSLPSRGAPSLAHRHWILPSSGWSAIHPEVQQLLGDVVLMRNLSWRGETVAAQQERLARSDRPELPPCLTRDSSTLDVTRTVGSAKISEPGSNCHDDCALRLCPYPPVGEPRDSAELTEGFCRELQQRRHVPTYASGVGRKDYQRLWREMSERLRPRRSTDSIG